MDNFNIRKYIDIAIKERYWIIVPFLLITLGGIGYSLTIPKIFQATTLILVQPQKVPQNFVRSIVSSDIGERLRTITQQVTSRTNLEGIIQQYDLYNEPENANMLLEDKVEIMRKRIDINVSRGSGGSGNAFYLSFQGMNPQKVAQVTNTLASKFISENLIIRESQAMGTSSFLSDELDTITKRLTEKEEQLVGYRLKYMGGLPDQVQTNLSMLNQLSIQMEQLNSNLNSAENRKLILQQQMSDSTLTQGNDTGPSEQPQEIINQASVELDRLKRQLSNLESRYTHNHPDVKRLKQMIANLEGDLEDTQFNPVAQSGAGPDKEEPQKMRFDNVITTQLRQVELEIEEIKQEIRAVQGRMKIYQNRVEDTPIREQEMLSMNRDYDNLREVYGSMLGRKLEAEIAVSMEKKQKGEQFRVIDPAKEPSRPIKPDMKKLLSMTLAFGLAVGCGLAYLKDFMDTSFRTPEEVESELNIPVLANLPFRYSEKELRAIKRNNVLVPACIFVLFFICLAGLLIGVKGLDPTILSVMDFIGMS